MSSDWASDPKYSTRPNIPTIAPRNSPLLLLGQKGGFRYRHNHSTLIIHHLSLCICLFSCPTHTPDTSASERRLHQIFAALCSLCSTTRCKSNNWRFCWNSSRNFPACNFVFDINTTQINHSSHFNAHTLNLQTYLIYSCPHTY